MKKWRGLVVGVAAVGLIGLTKGIAGAQGQNPFEKAIEDRFNSMDANKDGNISYDEYEAAYQKSIKRSFERRDQNKDGALSKEEFMPKIGKAGAKGTSNPFQRMMQKKKATGEKKPVQHTK